MESIFNEGFQPLTCDEDVLMLGKDTFVVRKFKDLVLRNIQQNIYSNYQSSKQLFLLMQMTGALSCGNIHFQSSESHWKFCTQDVECQLLGFGYSAWQKGKLRIKTDIDLCNHQKVIIKINLEFCLKEQNEYQDPIDKLRQL
ncbi:MAG: KGK domain-containing protein [Limnoraphis robusta]|jgi:hypothetical protein